jgi:hypothetical protein
MENKRIPFDWEKYQSGEYTPITRKDKIPEMIVHNPNAKKDDKIVFWVDGVCVNRSLIGLKSISSDYDLDIFLIPKPKKHQAWVNLYSNGDCYKYETKQVAEIMNLHYLQKGFELIECRLIEWEG